MESQTPAQRLAQLSPADKQRLLAHLLREKAKLQAIQREMRTCRDGCKMRSLIRDSRHWDQQCGLQRSAHRIADGRHGFSRRPSPAGFVRSHHRIHLLPRSSEGRS